MKKFLSYALLAGCVYGSVVFGEENVYDFRGVHFLASYLQCDEKALKDVSSLKLAMLEAVEDCGATILDEVNYVFPPDGFTLVVLLSESHASIHTYPEHGACFVDLFTCGDKCSAEKFDKALRKYLKPALVSEKTLLRSEIVAEKAAFP